MISYAGDPDPGQVILSVHSQTTPGSGYSNRKFEAYNYGTYRQAREESQDYPILRLAEVYLIYAEALYERYGEITDVQLNASINKVRERAEVGPLTNALVSDYNLNILEEIRRERTIELFGENSRFNDLKRWGIAEQELGQALLGAVIEGTDYENNPDLYNPAGYPGEQKVMTGKGELNAVILEPASTRLFDEDKHYLFPIPEEERQLNPNLAQNPLW